MGSDKVWGLAVRLSSTQQLHSQVKEKSYHSSCHFWATCGSDITVSAVLINKKQCLPQFRRIRGFVYNRRQTIIPSSDAYWSISVLFFAHWIDLTLLHSTVAALRMPTRTTGKWMLFNDMQWRNRTRIDEWWFVFEKLVPYIWALKFSSKPISFSWNFTNNKIRRRVVEEVKNFLVFCILIFILLK